jgi:hypothetical protein
LEKAYIGCKHAAYPVMFVRNEILFKSYNSLPAMEFSSNLLGREDLTTCMEVSESDDDEYEIVFKEACL